MPERFRQAIGRIMVDGGELASLSARPPGKPSSYGWVRCSDRDRYGAEAWELPDGEIRLVPPCGNPEHERAARDARLGGGLNG